MTKAGTFGAVCLTAALWPGQAAASGPLEYPDNGSAAFSRGGAWLAVGTDPIAAHYNPAALALGRGGVSLEQNIAFNKVCYDRRGPGNELTGPAQGTDPAPPAVVYRPVCNRRANAPRYVPSLSASYRLAPRIGIGIAVVPPAAYGGRAGDFPVMVDGYHTKTGKTVKVPAPYRHQILENDSIILLPTASVGVAVSPSLRFGAGFVWGVASIDVETMGYSTVNPADVGDHAADESLSRFKARDLFVPGFVASAHWSAHDKIDVAVWYRWIDAVRTRDTEVTEVGGYFKKDLSGVNELCKVHQFDPGNPQHAAECQGKAIENEYVASEASADQRKQYSFRFKLPMEARAGVRYHEPRSRNAAPPDVVPTRDPLHDDIWDVEIDVTWTRASEGSNVEVRFPSNDDGTGLLIVNPVGKMPPNSDRRYGYEDTFGARLGGQGNVIADKLGLLAGAWIESAAQQDEDLTLSPVAALRGGVGGGIVLRQDRFDLHVGYQRHWNRGYDNGGNGRRRANAGTVTRPEGEFRLDGPEGANEFRSYHTVNGGRVVQSANVFTLGAIYRF